MMKTHCMIDGAQIEIPIQSTGAFPSRILVSQAIDVSGLERYWNECAEDRGLKQKAG